MRKINKPRIVLMLKTGLNEQQIAERLNVSLRSVFRVAAEYKLKPARDLANMTPDQEHALWQSYYEITGSKARVAEMFGVSRSAVTQYLKKA
jgi:DNA-directed RNA polymerase specialized sigma subunit